MDDKTAIAGEKRLEIGKTHVSDLTASGCAKTQEKNIKARNAEFAAAISENRPNAWGRGYLTLYCHCLILYLCSTMNG